MSTATQTNTQTGTAAEPTAIDCGELHAAIQDPAAEAAWVLLDVRTPGEFRAGHVEGSVNIPLADLDAHRAELRRLTADRRIALVCRTGRRADEAREHLARAGIGSCCVVSGGIVAWEEQALPVRRGRSGFAIERQVRLIAGLLVLVGTLLGAFVSPWLLIVPGFVGAGLTFAGATDWCGMALLLGRLPFNRRGRDAGCPFEAAGVSLPTPAP